MKRNNLKSIGSEMYSFIVDLFPICRSITGDGARKTLCYLKDIVNDLNIYEIPCGTKVFDWTIPEEWNINEAWIQDSSGNIIIDFKKNNLHVVGYSEPVNKTIKLSELRDYLYTLPDQPDAIPYVTSYYKKRWGFCLSYSQFKTLADGNYKVFIDSNFSNGVLNYGEIIIKGKSDKEILLSTYICHPSMANNELSGPVVTIALAKWLKTRNNLFTYRIIFIPETIGSLTYLSKHLNHLKSHVIAGFNITCVGDNREYSYLPSRNGSTLSDRIALHVLNHIAPKFKKYTWLDRGSDERQYCAPGVDLPIASIMRTKYGEYPEYHTSLDDLSLVNPEGLEGAYHALKTSIEGLEKNCIPIVTVQGEPNLGSRNLYENISVKNIRNSKKSILNLLTYADGKEDLLSIADKINIPIADLYEDAKLLESHNLLFLNEIK